MNNVKKKTKQKPPVKKNDTLTLTFTDLTHEGNGVGKIGHYPLFVPYALPGEEATVKVVKVNKNFGYGKLLSIKKASPERREPPCNVFYQCGGCQLQHMSYDMQLEMKRKQVTNVLRKIARLDDVPVHPVLGMEEPWHYRNKIQIPVGEKDGKLITGFYQERSHRIIPNMETCLIQNEKGDEIVAKVRKVANELGIPAYDENTHQGVLRHIIVRTAYETNDTMVILITKTAQLPNEAALVKRLTEAHPEIKSIIHNINNAQTNVILGWKTRTIYGADIIIDSIGDLQFHISPKSFFQVNPAQTKVLYEKALEYANVSADDTVIDAYCGTGTISLFLAKQAQKVYGVEIVPDAIRDARKNAELNKIANVEFVVGEAEIKMAEWQQQGMKPNVIVVDPPRKGCEATLLEAMIAMAPERIVYVSCNPSTLARDLRILKDGGYRTKEVQPVDMFGMTGHVECVALMSRVDE